MILIVQCDKIRHGGVSSGQVKLIYIISTVRFVKMGWLIEWLRLSLIIIW